MRCILKKLLIIISLSSLCAFANIKCFDNSKSQGAEVEMFQLKSFYQLYFDGSYLSCEQKCFKKTDCINRCQKKEAMRSVKSYMKEKHGNKYRKCQLWSAFVSSL
jgi:plasmid maintenance system killer protein